MCSSDDLNIAYDRFASIYNEKWGSRSLDFLPAYWKHALHLVPSEGKVLDLCCGTGQLAHALSYSGFQVVGLDCAAAMLRIARMNAPAATFVLGDVRAFRSSTRFNAALCVYDSLNHMMTLYELRRAFQTAHQCVMPGGVFAFDMNMEGKYAKRWTGMFTVEGDDYRCNIKTTTDMEQKTASFKAVIEDDIMRNQSLTVSLSQTWYSASIIENELKRGGFQVCGQHVLVSGPESDSEPDRLLFVCRSS